MTDIVEHLRMACNEYGYCAGSLAGDAADEIERLRAENEKLRTLPMKYRRMEFNAQLQKENEELRAELAQRQSLSADAVFANNEIMAINAGLGLRINQIMDLIGAVERAHGIKSDK